MKTVVRIEKRDTMTDKDRALTHQRIAHVNRVRNAQGYPPLSLRSVEHDRSIAAYDRALGEGRN